MVAGSSPAGPTTSLRYPVGVRKTSIRTAVTAGACLTLTLFPTACTPAEDSADTHRDDGSEATTDAEATDRWSAFADILDDPSALDLASNPSPDATGDYSSPSATSPATTSRNYSSPWTIRSLRRYTS